MGVAYYAQWKVTQDQMPNLDELRPEVAAVARGILGTKHKVYGVGPEVSVFLPTKLEGNTVHSGLSIAVRYFWETGAINKTEGGGFVLSLAYLF